MQRAVKVTLAISAFLVLLPGIAFAQDGQIAGVVRDSAGLVMPGVLVVDIGIAQNLLKMPDQLSRLLVGKAKGKPATLDNIVGDKLRLIAPGMQLSWYSLVPR